MKLKNGKVVGMNNALQALAQGGVKDNKNAKRLTKMILFISDHAEEVLKQRDVLLRGLAKTGDDDRPVTTPDGQSLEWENKMLAELEISEFMRLEDIEIPDDEFPTPWTWEELTEGKIFKKTPTPDLIAALGPLVTID